jgi:hypothetical protein
VALGTGSLRVGPHRPDAPEALLRSAHGRILLAADDSGRCRFLEPGGTCAVHRQIGHDALPVSCRLFPRVCLLAPRGVTITLSHYCPTAAGLLFADSGPLEVVRNPPGFPETSAYEGLDARGSPPPLLRPGVWLGWDGHERWERHVIGVLDGDGPPEPALARLADQAEEARSWTIARGPFGGFLEEVLGRPWSPDVRAAPLDAPDGDRLWDDVLRSVPAPLRPAEPKRATGSAGGWAGLDRPVRRYLAARAFGSWASVQGAGLRTSVRALQAARAVLERECDRASAAARRPLDRALLEEAIRRSDLLLVHLASPEVLARRLSVCEAAA